MPNTGVKQATVAYKVSQPGGEPLDIDGVPISQSGKRQAIMLLIGRPNPNASLYEVQAYFNEGDLIDGLPSQVYDETACPVGFMSINPSSIVLWPGEPQASATIFSSNPWTLLPGGPTAYASITPTTGPAGSTVLAVTAVGPEGQGYFTFQDNVTLQTVTLFVVSTLTPTGWILETGFWNDNAFWTAGGIWNY